MMTPRKVLETTAVLLALAVSVAITGVVIVVIIHFVVKFW